MTEALQVNYTDELSKAVLPTAYVRVLDILIHCAADSIEVVLGIYSNVAAFGAGGMPVFVYHTFPPYNTLMETEIFVLTTILEYVKTLPAFAGATDVE